MKLILIALFISSSFAAVNLEEETTISIETIYNSSSYSGRSYTCLSNSGANFENNVTRVVRVIAGNKVSYELYSKNGFEATCDGVQ